VTAEHLAALQEGRARKAERDAEERAARRAAYSAWVKRDAVRWRQLRDAREDGDAQREARIRADMRADPMPPSR
jgi:hypothetical protein